MAMSCKICILLDRRQPGPTKSVFMVIIGWLVGWLVGNSVFSKSKMSLLVTMVKAWSKELHPRLYGSPRYDSEEFEGLNMI